MAKKTKAEILNIIAEMHANDEKITVRSVRDKIGSGSLSDIAPVVKEYQSTHTVESAPERVYEALSGVADRLWHDAMSIAKETWAGERIDFVNQVEDLEAELDEARKDLTSKSSDIANRDAQIADLKVDKARAEERAETVRREAQAIADERIKAMSDELSKQKIAVASFEAELKGKVDMIASLEKMIASFQQQQLPLETPKKDPKT